MPPVSRIGVTAALLSAVELLARARLLGDMRMLVPGDAMDALLALWFALLFF